VIQVGDTVIWENEDDDLGSVRVASAPGVDGDLAFDTGSIGPERRSRPIRFTKAGRVPYHSSGREGRSSHTLIVSPGRAPEAASSPAEAAFSPDGKTVALGSAASGVVRLWDTATGRERPPLEDDDPGFRGVAFSPDGKTLASGGDDKVVRLWDVATGEGRATLTGHADRVSWLAFSPDGKILASRAAPARATARVKLWDVAAGKEKAVPKGHTGFVSSVAFSPDGKALASAGEDGTVRLWDASTGKQRACLSGHARCIRSVVFSPDGKALASAGADQTLKVWSVAAAPVNGYPPLFLIRFVCGQPCQSRSAPGVMPRGRVSCRSCRDGPPTVTCCSSSVKDKGKFLCGHDERHWFVAAVPESAPVGTVRQAKEALKPAEVHTAQGRERLNAQARGRRENAAYARQGEWFFLPAADAALDEGLVLRDEPLTRGSGGKPHWAESWYRTGGEAVYVCTRYPDGVTEAQYKGILAGNRKAKHWGWRTMRRNPGVYVRGRIRHADHTTITPHFWHRVVLNTWLKAGAGLPHEAASPRGLPAPPPVGGDDEQFPVFAQRQPDLAFPDEFVDGGDDTLFQLQPAQGLRNDGDQIALAAVLALHRLTDQGLHPARARLPPARADDHVERVGAVGLGVRCFQVGVHMLGEDAPHQGGQVLGLNEGGAKELAYHRHSDFAPELPRLRAGGRHARPPLGPGHQPIQRGGARSVMSEAVTTVPRFFPASMPVRATSSFTCPSVPGAS
jgi:WD40 repeat protein